MRSTLGCFDFLIATATQLCPHVCSTPDRASSHSHARTPCREILPVRGTDRVFTDLAVILLFRFFQALEIGRGSFYSPGRSRFSATAHSWNRPANTRLQPGQFERFQLAGIGHMGPRQRSIKSRANKNSGFHCWGNITDDFDLIFSHFRTARRPHHGSSANG